MRCDREIERYIRCSEEAKYLVNFWDSTKINVCTTHVKDYGNQNNGYKNPIITPLDPKLMIMI